MTTERERVEELARTNALGLVDDDDAVWGQCLASIGQAAHTKLSRSLGVGAPNAVETSVAKAREVARLPRPRRPATGEVVDDGAVLWALRGTSTPQSAAQIADTLGDARSKLIDMPSVSRALRALLKVGDIVQSGSKRGAKYEPAGRVVAAPPSGPSVLEADEGAA